MKHITLCACLFFIQHILFAQVILTEPYFPTAESTVTIIYDASQGNAALEDYAGTVYAHTGVITDASTSPSDWKHVQGIWGTADAEVEMTSIGDNMYSITFNITDFYGITGGEIVYQMAFVFRNTDGTIVGRNADGSDIFTAVYEPGLHVSILSPSASPLLFNEGDLFTLTAASSASTLLEVYQDDILESSTSDTSLSIPFIASGSGTHTIIAIASDGISSVSDTISYFIKPEITVAELPAGVKQGINYLDDNTATLVLFAPFKEYVFAIGDFSNWQVNEDVYMNVTPDGNTYWKTITGLTAGQEYTFQYLIDGNLKVCDPLCEKILDPSNDSYIPAATYPELLAYPTGKTTGNVSVLQTAQPEYVWTDTEFEPVENTDLILYELLIRDFSVERNFQALIDSINYLATLGVNAIELMPVNEFEGNESWGYNPSFFTALDKYYGTKDKLKEFVNLCHSKGIAVILDIAMNHTFSQSPLAQMWWDPIAFAPSAENPYLNQIPKHDYNVGYDFNHESDATKKFRTLAFRYWLQEYHIDGYRFDLSKGYTQNNTLGDVAAWGMYDASRIAIWNDISDSIRLIKNNAILILEHFAENSEEEELSSDGFLLWGNLNYNFNQATMGYSGNDIGWLSYKNRGWDEPHVVGYMESHDEERIMFKNITYGNTTNPDYNAKTLYNALARTEAAAVFLMSVPGPKMIWQFGELGYDISIDYGCRVCNKPVKWEYYDDVNRYKLYQVYAAMNHLKTNYAAFKTTDFNMSVGSFEKRINLNDDEMNVTVLGNFDVYAQDIDPNFQQTGKWYEYFSGDSISVSDIHASISLSPGAYRLYTDKKLTQPDIIDGISMNMETSVTNISAYPNPSTSDFVIQYSSISNTNTEIKITNLTGEILYTTSVNTVQGNNKLVWQGKDMKGNKVAVGIYLLKLSGSSEFNTLKLVVQ